MNQTKRLYYEDAYQTEFTARVRAVGEDRTGRYLVLDRTLFFPEGGGQPADTGYLNDCPVRDVQIVEGEIRHYIVLLSSLREGDEVTGQIDWERRFDLMQQHSGEHIVSGLIHERFGYDNVGFHMGERYITIDLNGEIDSQQLAEIEKEANDYIWGSHPVRAFFASEEEIRTLPYRSKLELSGEVRLLEFPGADLCACCGIHVNNTGQIGLIRLISVHHFRQGVRIEMVSGRRAFEEMRVFSEQNSLVAIRLSAKPEDTAEAVDKLLAENYRLKGKIIRLEKEKHARIAQSCCGLGNVLVFVPDLTPADIRKCTDDILEVCGGVGIVLSGDDDQGYRYAIGVRQGDIRGLVKEMNETLAGRGGGKPFFAQGSLKGGHQKVRDFFTDKEYAILDM